MMTNQQIIDVVTAEMSGKTIMRRRRFTRGNSNSPWTFVDPSVMWDFIGYDYMVDPDPRTLYAEIMPDGMLMQSSLEPFEPTNGGKVVKFKEVKHE